MKFIWNWEEISNMSFVIKKIKKVLVVNWGEIVICVFWVCIELNIWIVVIYFKEDVGFYYCYKVDEVYLVGVEKKLIDVYLDIEGIIDIVKFYDVDVIYFGYGFLLENI